jgi:hypothetical protein
MAVSKHKPGMFCWVELGTTDQPSAKKFYSELFGWGVNDIPMGPDSVYSMMQIEGMDAAAISQLSNEQISMNVPPHWLLYVSVESADKTAKAIAAAGGRLMMEPFDVFDVGRMTVAQDPVGAAFGIWQPRKHIGVQVINELNALCWQELNTREPDAASKFYRKVFGWKPQVKEFGVMTYTEFYLGDQAAGGMFTLTPQMGDISSHWMPYFAVEDCDARLEKAKSLGATVLAPPQDVPEVGRFTTLLDKQGAVFSIIKLDAMS